MKVELLVQSCLIVSVSSSLVRRIIGGSEASKPYKWMALLYHNIDDTNLCGGARYTWNTVITAGHCMIDEIHETRVYFNRLSRDRNANEPESSSHKVLSRIAHPDVGKNRNMHNYDISVWHIEADKVEGNFVTLDDGSWSSTGSPVLSLGWGLLQEQSSMFYDSGIPPMKLHELKSKVTDWETCRRSLRRTLDPVSMICTGDGKGGKGMCQGDSGGPVVALTDDLPVLVGINSWGERCAWENKYDIHVRISHVAPWIREVALCLPDGCKEKFMGNITTSAQSLEHERKEAELYRKFFYDVAT